MKTRITKRSGMSAIMLAAAAVGFGVMPATATAQVVDPVALAAWPYAMGYIPPYGSGATAYESFLRGQASVLRSEGELARDLAHASQLQAEATRQILENRDVAFQQRLQFRRMGLAQRDAVFQNVQERRDLHRALSDAESLLETSESLIGPHETRAEAKLRLTKELLDEDAQTTSAGKTVAFDE